jgi:hypothetical protein
MEQATSPEPAPSDTLPAGVRREVGRIQFTYRVGEADGVWLGGGVSVGVSLGMSVAVGVTEGVTVHVGGRTTGPEVRVGGTGELT